MTKIPIAKRGERTAAFSMRLHPAVRDAIQELAEADGRSFTNYVERVLTAHVQEAAEAKSAKRRG